ncbi:glycosyltransferase family 4 protein [Flavobacterium psychrophilum]
MIMEYSIVFVSLLVILMTYFKVANYFNIVDKPNERSAHKEITLRGGGVVFWFASLLYLVQNSYSKSSFFVGITIVSGVSFWDDIKSLPNKVRIIAQLLAMSIIFYFVHVYEFFPLYGVVLVYVFAVGIINAYNFLDGINGITGLYSVVVLGSLLFVNECLVNFVDNNFIVYPIIACIVFLIFNFRKRAKCFAGDVGSIAVAFWVIYLILVLIIETKSYVWLLFLVVYGVDSVCTILHRLCLRQNIFLAHRLHFYQVLCNDYGLDHRLVAFLYAVIQLGMSAVVIFFFRRVNDFYLFLLLIIPLVLLYNVKFYLINKKG